MKNDSPEQAAEPEAEPDPASRFARQIRFAPLGLAGQERLAGARVLIVGCGALGGALAQSLARSGVGRLVLVDRDVVEHSNLPRQVLFDEAHAERRAPKVEAAAEVLARIGGPTRVEPHAAHLDADNIEELAQDVDLILDGTDNLATRYLLNDFAVSEELPWIYAGVVACAGLVLAVLPGGPCLRCIFPDPPPPGSLETCDTAGVLQPAVGLVAAMQAGWALRLLGQDPEQPALEPALVQLDAWSGEVRRIAVTPRTDCPACGRGEFPFLDAPPAQTSSLCGRNAVQVRGSRRQAPDFEALARSLEGLAQNLRRSGAFLRFEVEECAFTVFPDGRALVEGTEDTDRARALYDRYVGS